MVCPVLWIDAIEIIKKEINVFADVLPKLLVGTATTAHIELVCLNQDTVI